jgi:hypothetical protein|tara:strand:+ start:244 stop:741 length:498 start_codon:yes stop_codon:yes gene_type:complete
LAQNKINYSIWISDPEDAEAIAHADLRALYGYWQDKRAGRLAPTRADIDPLDFPGILPNIFLFKVLRRQDSPELDFQASLMGTRLVQHMGRDDTGKGFAEIFRGAPAVTMKVFYDRVAQTGEVCYSQLDASWMDKKYLFYERLLLPLSDDGVTVNRLIGCSLFHR